MNIKANDIYSADSAFLSDLYQPGQGFYIPRYQRKYTWESDAIEELINEICLGIDDLTSDKDTATFIGTVILISLNDSDRKKINLDDPRSVPGSVKLVIDGQQRLSTLALIGTRLEIKLNELLSNISDDENYFHTLEEQVKYLLEELRKLYSLDLKRGNPKLKPRIIRSKDDKWTYDGDDTFYNSEIGRYIATYIRYMDAGKTEVKGKRLKDNLDTIDSLLESIINSDVTDTHFYDSYPSGKNLNNPNLVEFILGYEHDDDIEYIVSQGFKETGTSNYFAARLLQLIIFGKYLIERTCLTRLEPINEDWGFDMFQSLNSTGTPLTAIETFLPIVMKEEETNCGVWDGSPSAESMSIVSSAFEALDTNAEKDTFTNELLRTLFLIYSGERVENKFSIQKRKLDKHYSKGQSLEQKRNFVELMSHITQFYRSVWRMEETTIPDMIKGLDGDSGKLASFLVSFLRDANSRLSAPILAAFYKQILEEKENAIDEFINAVKACAAFFALWRSSFSTSGLDDVYRNYFKGSKKPVKVSSHAILLNSGQLKASSLIKYFKEVLSEKGISKKSDWIKKSVNFLTYDNVNKICKFYLFLALHDSTPDKGANAGLMKLGTKGVANYLTIEKWKSSELKTIEHVAPKKPPKSGSKWDVDIYSEDIVHTLGNLLLLSHDLNNRAGNKSWLEKRFYYCYVGNRDPSDVKKLESEAKKDGIVLNQRTKKALQASSYQDHIEHITKLKKSANWDMKFIQKRTKRIMGLSWDRLSVWLDL